MFSHLKSIVDLIRSGIIEFSKFQSVKERNKSVLNILKVYFFLKDCVDDGEKLITATGNNPVDKISSIGNDEAISVIAEWDNILRKQGIRLYSLQGYICGQDHLSVINPKLQKQINEVIGYKMDRILTLHGIGSALVMRNIFPIEESNEEKARLITLMAGVKDGDLLDLEKITAEITALRSSLDDYRTVVERLVTDKELVSLSKKARKETLIPDLA